MTKVKYESSDILTIKHRDKKHGCCGVTEMEGIFIGITNLNIGSEDEPNFAIEIDAQWPYTDEYRKMFFTVKEKTLMAYPDEWFIK